MRLVISCLAILTTLAASPLAQADNDVPPPPGVSASPVLGQPAPAAAPAAPDKAQADPDVRGGVFQMDVGLSRLGGDFAENVPVGVFGFSLGLRGGYTVTPHTTLLAGVKLGMGSMTGCRRDDKCSAYSASAPLTVEYAFDRADRGLFVEGGLSLLNVHHMMPPGASITMFSPANGLVGAGYRIPFKVSKDLTRHLDFALRGSVGAFTHGNVTVGDTTVAGGIDALALHHEITFAMGFRF